MAMVELSEEEVNIVPEPVLSQVDFESETDLFKSFQGVPVIDLTHRQLKENSALFLVLNQTIA